MKAISKYATGIAMISMLVVSPCFAKSSEVAVFHTGRDCQNGQVKACDKIRKIVTTAKKPSDRLEAVPFISDTSLLSAIANDASQTREVSAAAAARVEKLNKEAQYREDEQKMRAQIQAQIREEAQRGSDVKGLGHGAKGRLRFKYLVLPDGTRLPLRGAVDLGGKDYSKGAIIAFAAVFDREYLAATGLGFAIPAGTTMSVQLDGDQKFRVGRASTSK